MKNIAGTEGKQITDKPTVYISIPNPKYPERGVGGGDVFFFSPPLLTRHLPVNGIFSVIPKISHDEKECTVVHVTCNPSYSGSGCSLTQFRKIRALKNFGWVRGYHGFG